MTETIVLSDHDQKRFWVKVSMPDANGCMVWKDAPNWQGYGRIGIGAKNNRNGRYVKAHRLSLWLSAGAPPVGREQTAHSCRTKLCVAPLHLRWASSKENMEDRDRDGTTLRGEQNGNSRLSAKQVLEIRNKYARKESTQVQLAAQYGVSQTTVSGIVLRKQWRGEPR